MFLPSSLSITLCVRCDYGLGSNQGKPPPKPKTPQQPALQRDCCAHGLQYSAYTQQEAHEHHRRPPTLLCNVSVVYPHRIGVVNKKSLALFACHSTRCWSENCRPSASFSSTAPICPPLPPPLHGSITKIEGRARTWAGGTDSTSRAANSDLSTVNAELLLPPGLLYLWGERGDSNVRLGGVFQLRSCFYEGCKQYTITSLLVYLVSYPILKNSNNIPSWPSHALVEVMRFDIIHDLESAAARVAQIVPKPYACPACRTFIRCTVMEGTIRLAWRGGD